MNWENLKQFDLHFLKTSSKQIFMISGSWLESGAILLIYILFDCAVTFNIINSYRSEFEAVCIFLYCHFHPTYHLNSLLCPTPYKHCPLIIEVLIPSRLLIFCVRARVRACLCLCVCVCVSFD